MRIEFLIGIAAVLLVAGIALWVYSDGPIGIGTKADSKDAVATSGEGARDPDGQTVAMVSYDFNDGTLGWIAGFSGFPVGGNIALDQVARVINLPEELGPGTGYYIQSDNIGDGLFMFLKRRLGTADGVAVGQAYQLHYTLTFASNTPDGCQGAPGESVWQKAGGSTIEPLSVAGIQRMSMNVDTGQAAANSGGAASVTGDIANGTDCGEVQDSGQAPYVSLTRTHTHPDPVMAAEDGTLWLLVASDSAYLGKTGLYYQRIDVELIPVN